MLAVPKDDFGAQRSDLDHERAVRFDPKNAGFAIEPEADMAATPERVLLLLFEFRGREQEAMEVPLPRRQVVQLFASFQSSPAPTSTASGGSSG